VIFVIFEKLTPWYTAVTIQLDNGIAAVEAIEAESVAAMHEA
jgi:hypothetical protein